LLPELKRQCGAFLGTLLCSSLGLSLNLGNFLELSNCVSLLRTARLFNLARLEHNCMVFMAANIESLTVDEEFKALVLEDASNVEDRQATDSVDVIDEIRFVLRSDLSANTSLDAAEEAAASACAAIDDMLEELGLDG